MSSNAFSTHLVALLKDAEELDDSHSVLGLMGPQSQLKLDALNRAVVVMSVSAWEAYIEELVVESVNVMRPAGIIGSWAAHYASTLGQARRFHTPDPGNVKALLSDAVGLTDIHSAWNWPGSTSAQVVQSLTEVLNFRHKIAHGTIPRPAVSNMYSSGLLVFFRSLGLTTDQAVRNHLINVLGIQNPWPP